MPTAATTRRALLVPVVLTLVAACRTGPAPAADEHAGTDHGAATGSAGAGAGAGASASATATAVADDKSLPPDAEGAAARLAASPRHGEYVMIGTGPAATDSIRAWVVYPERKTKAPVVVVIHEIFGLSTWIRGVADQLAADGYIAVAPDLLTGRVDPNAPDSVKVAAIRGLAPAVAQRGIEAAGRYGMSLPAAVKKFGVVGFCWGGSATFATAATVPSLGAAVAYYGAAPVDRVQLANTKAPVLALYGENDARVNATIPAADSALKQAGARFERETFAGAGHGFLRQQSGQNGANAAATRAAWPRTIRWFRQHLGE
jgi:carboxymethylenebutenolidase